MKINTDSITIGEQDIKMAKYLADKEYNKAILDRIIKALLSQYHIERFKTSTSNNMVTSIGKNKSELCEELVNAICQKIAEDRGLLQETENSSQTHF